MNELLNINQLIRVIPQDFQYSNRGIICDILKEGFVIKLAAPPEGFVIGQVIEFYSPTKFGTLFFNSSIAKVDGDKIVVLKPKKHRFLQRRTFTRIKFAENIDVTKNDKKINATAVDLAAGGIKMKSEEKFELDETYSIKFPLSGGNDIRCKFIPVLVQHAENDIYTVAGKLVDLPYKDRMRIIQYCLRKDIEYNRK
jgi:hypothetical protein